MRQQQQLRDDPKYDVLTDFFILTSLTQNPENAMDRIKKEIEQISLDTQVDPENRVNEDTFLESIRASAIKKSKQRKGVPTKFVRAKIGEIREKAEPIIDKFTKENGIREENGHQRIFKKQFDKVLKNVVVLTSHIAKTGVNFAPIFYEDNDLQEKVIEKLLQDFKSIFNAFPDPRNSKKPPSLWRAIRPDLYSLSYVKEIIGKYKRKLPPSMIYKSFSQNPNNPELKLESYKEKRYPSRKKTEITTFIGDPLINYAKDTFNSGVKLQDFIHKAEISKKRIFENSDRSYLSLGGKIIDIAIATNVDEPEILLDKIMDSLDRMLADPQLSVFTFKEIRDAVVSAPTANIDDIIAIIKVRKNQKSSIVDIYHF